MHYVLALALQNLRFFRFLYHFPLVFSRRKRNLKNPNPQSLMNRAHLTSSRFSIQVCLLLVLKLIIFDWPTYVSTSKPVCAIYFNEDNYEHILTYVS